MAKRGAKDATPPAPPPKDPLTTREGMEAFLREQPREVSIAVAARAALRVLPLFASAKLKDETRFSDLTIAVFRAVALARVAGKYPARAKDLSAAAAAREAGSAASSAAYAASAASSAASAANHAAASVSAGSAAASAASAGSAAAHTAGAYTGPVAAAATAADARRAASAGAAAVLDDPLWPLGAPDWATAAWMRLVARLPADSGWQVWRVWYEERLRGGSRGEPYEMAFATVPDAVWDRGAAAANAWILEHLPEPLSVGKEREEQAEPTALEQKAALYAFGLDGEKIVVLPERAPPEDREITEDFLDEARRKAQELLERLVRVQADARLQNTLRILESRLGSPIAQMRIGLVVSSLTSIESDHSAYDTDEGRKEHAPDLLAALDDLAGTVRLFVGQFPRAREVLANQIALGLSENPAALDEVQRVSEDLSREAAVHGALVDASAPGALLEPKQAIDDSRTLKDRAKQLGLRLLTVENFARIVAQTRQMALDSWDDVRKTVPKAVGQATKTVIVGAPLVGLDLWLGHEATALLAATVTAVSVINKDLGKKGGAFDRLLKTIETIAAREPPPAAAAQPKSPPTPKPRAAPKKPRGPK